MPLTCGTTRHLEVMWQRRIAFHSRNDVTDVWYHEASRGDVAEKDRLPSPRGHGLTEIIARRHGPPARSEGPCYDYRAQALCLMTVLCVFMMKVVRVMSCRFMEYHIFVERHHALVLSAVLFCVVTMEGLLYVSPFIDRTSVVAMKGWRVVRVARRSHADRARTLIGRRRRDDRAVATRCTLTNQFAYRVVAGMRRVVAMMRLLYYIMLYYIIFIFIYIYIYIYIL